ncbi:MAG: hypothetical protein PHT07_20570 [Paludibacter sp.]|nr:hypothetical protein [Paludibacter sp.]
MKTSLITKKLLVLFALVIMTLACVFLSCTSNDPANSGLPGKPEALAANDHSSAGVIKGVLVGSTGVFKFSIKNGNDSIYCKVTFDGKTGLLLAPSMSTWTAGQVIAATFTGNVGGTEVSVYLKCNADGGSPTATFTIPGHQVSVSLYKETSTSLVKGYEGTYSTVNVSSGAKIDNGTFNFILYNGLVAGTHSGTDGSGTFTATVSGTKMTFLDDNSTRSQVLDIDDTTVSGSMFTSSDNTEKTTVAGKRTL